MGNVLSDEDDMNGGDASGTGGAAHRGSFLEDGFNLDSPDADKAINYGAAAPRCQPRHTEEELLQQQLQQEEEDMLEEELVAAVAAASEAAANQQHNNNNGSNNGSASISSGSDNDDESGQEVGILNDNSINPDAHLRGEGDGPRKNGEHRGKRQHVNNNNGSSSNSSAAAAAAAQQQQQKQKLSYIQMAKLGYQELVNAIIRPPRADYKMETLGPPAFNFCGKRFTRTDFCLRTKRGYNLECSHWEPVERATDRIPVVIYMHGNSSARVEVIPQLSYLLSLGLAVFAFDFAGSGKSDGDYVSLGYYEREDLSCIVAHLRATNVVSTIALWGRSMGAATALMFGDRDPSIACMILDSPFCDLTQLCEEMVEKGREQGIIVPNFVVSMAIRMLQSSVKKQAGFNLRQISPIAHADKCFIPALFVAGEHDDFIKKHHSEQIHQVYAGDKNLIVVEGDHNSPRPKFMFDSASIFLQTCLQIPNEWALQVPVSMNLMSPPWFYELHQQRAAARRHQHELLQQQQQQQQLLSMATNATSSSNSSMSGGEGDAASRRTTSSAMTARAGSSSSAIASSNNSMDPIGNGFNHEDMGMTAERQRVIQASLFKMLGQADSVDTSTTSVEATSSSTGKKKPTTRRSSSGGVKDDHQQQQQYGESSSSNTTNGAAAMGVEVGIPIGPPRSSRFNSSHI